MSRGIQSMIRAAQRIDLKDIDLGRSDKLGTVYVVGYGPYVKIGFTSGVVAKRVASLATGAPEQLVIYGEIIGSRKLELALHRQFFALRLQGEWFRREGLLAKWIDDGCPTDSRQERKDTNRTEEPRGNEKA